MSERTPHPSLHLDIGDYMKQHETQDVAAQREKKLPYQLEFQLPNEPKFVQLKTFVDQCCKVFLQSTGNNFENDLQNITEMCRRVAHDKVKSYADLSTVMQAQPDLLVCTITCPIEVDRGVVEEHSYELHVGQDFQSTSYIVLKSLYDS